MALQIKKPDDFKILFIGGEQLKKDTEEMITQGKADFLEVGSEEAQALFADHPELLKNENLAVVSSGEDETGEACAISQAGKSLIVHCEDFVLPVKD
jgi:hypothetical protein